MIGEVYLIQLCMIGELYLILYDWRGVLDTTLYDWRGVLDATYMIGEVYFMRLYSIYRILSVSVVSHIRSLYEHCNITSPLLFLSIPSHPRMSFVDRAVIHPVRSY